MILTPTPSDPGMWLRMSGFLLLAIAAGNVITGWGRRDAPAALAKALDPETLGAYPRGGSEGHRLVTGLPPGLLGRAAAASPEETWHILGRHRRSDLGGEFFDGLAPELAKDYALRLAELFIDPERPGLELFGGLEIDLAKTDVSDRYLAASRKAAGGWLIRDPEAAFAWYLKQNPPVNGDAAEIGARAGELIGRWVGQEPGKAMAWARNKPQAMRVGLAEKVAATISSARILSKKQAAGRMPRRQT